MSEWKTETCETCEFQANGLCRCDPPVAQVLDGVLYTLYATTVRDGTYISACSKWRPIEPPATNIADLKDE